MTSHNVHSEVLRKRHVHGLRNGSVPVRSSKTSHNYHKRNGSGTSTAVLSGGAAGIGLLGGFRITISERAIQPTTRAQEPFDADVNRVPAGLELPLVPLTDRLQDVQGATISEVESRVPHGNRVVGWCK